MSLANQPHLPTHETHPPNLSMEQPVNTRYFDECFRKNPHPRDSEWLVCLGDTFGRRDSWIQPYEGHRSSELPELHPVVISDMSRSQTSEHHRSDNATAVGALHCYLPSASASPPRQPHPRHGCCWPHTEGIHVPGCVPGPEGFPEGMEGLDLKEHPKWSHNMGQHATTGSAAPVAIHLCIVMYRILKETMTDRPNCSFMEVVNGCNANDGNIMGENDDARNKCLDH